MLTELHLFQLIQRRFGRLTVDFFSSFSPKAGRVGSDPLMLNLFPEVLKFH